MPLKTPLCAWKTLFTVPTVTGFLCLVFLGFSPSEQTQAIWLGFSPLRLMMLTFCTLLLIVCFICLWKSWSSDSWIESVRCKIEPFLLKDQNLITISFWLFIFVTAGFILPFLYNSLASLIVNHAFAFFTYDYVLNATRILEMTKTIFLRAWPFYVWLWLCLAFSLAFILMQFSSQFHQKELYRGSVIPHNLCIFVILLTTILHWIILYFRLDFFQMLPHWFWKFYDKPTQRLWLIPLGLVLSLLAAWLILKFPRRKSIGLLLLFMLGLVFQYGFGWAEGNGDLLRIYRDRGRIIYSQRVCEGVSVADILFHYEDVAQGEMTLNTKPPGTLLVYAVARDFSQLATPAVDFKACYQQLTSFIVVVFPVLALLVLGVLYGLGRNLLGEDNALLVPLCYLFFPNFALIPLELDQVLFPLLFTVGLYCTLKAIQKNSIAWSAFAGMFSFLGLYFSFAFLPLPFLCAAWLIFNAWQNRRSTSWQSSVRLLGSMAAGFLILLLLFGFFFQYDILLRYSQAMAEHRQAKEFGNNLQQILEALLLNNTEFTTWIGLPFTVLIVSSFFNNFRVFLRRTSSVLAPFFAAYVSMAILLNIAGQTRSEVARLWLFLLPSLSLLIAAELRFMDRHKTAKIMAVLFLQFLTTCLIFKLQSAG